MGTVAIDATRIKGSASPDKVAKHRYVKVRAMRRARGERLEARLKVRRWQRACDASDPNENAGSRVAAPLEARRADARRPGEAAPSDSREAAPEVTIFVK
jgi:hypothetical protein